MPTYKGFEWHPASLACTIVHEALHGRLFSLGIPYNEATQEQVERLCVKRERRFIARVPSERYDLTALVPPFDAAKWHDYWGSQMIRKELSSLRRKFFERLKQQGENKK